ncbi:hypothetical protein BC833DRAFT_620078 [Globomyces pollinis-pini]|nr:hypothetical protein BC833DRAFT_620078 [Globomyces pollinis-pini]
MLVQLKGFCILWIQVEVVISSTNYIRQASNSDCIRGTSIGSFILQTPNRSTVGVVGTPLIIQWTYTPFVTQIPNSIDLSLQHVQEGEEGPKAFGIVMDRNRTIGPSNSTSWLISPLIDGTYQLRISGSGQDSLLNKDVCLTDGQAGGATSASFKIVNPQVFPPITKDLFGPSTSAGTDILCAIWMYLMIHLLT